MTVDRVERGKMMVSTWLRAVHEHWPPELFILVLDRIEAGEIVEVR